MVFGNPTTIQATGQLGASGVDEHDAILLTHSDGQISSLYVSNRARVSPDMTLLGDKGRIHVHAPIFCPPALSICLEGQEARVLDYSDMDNGYAYQVREVIRCLQSGDQESQLMPLDETIRILETMDEIRRQIGMHYPQEIV